MRDVLLILYFVLCSLMLGSSDNKNRDESDDETPDEENEIDADAETDAKDEGAEYKTADEATANNDNFNYGPQLQEANCWLQLHAEKYYKEIDEIDEKFSAQRMELQQKAMEADFDKGMIEGFIRDRGMALRELASHQHKQGMIPSGMNLGGYCMLKMPDSVLFFHRMKLRNDTYFRVDWLHNELNHMMVRMNLSLNDLHLKGAYERSLTDIDPSVLLYAPTFGEVEFLLKDVKYKIEGRYRIIGLGRLWLELVTSEISTNNVLMTYVTQHIDSAPVRVKQENLGRFMSRLKIDLDKWIKDYFNDHLGYTRLFEIRMARTYSNTKAVALEKFTDFTIQALATRLRVMDAESIRIPSFIFKAIHGVQIKLSGGVINGLDTIYRRSVATGYKKDGIRRVDCIVGFSSLKVIYKYQALAPTGVPPLSGTLTVAADDLAAHLSMNIVDEPETLDLDIEFLDQMKPEFLTVEGDANVMIANFKHLLEHQIVAIMSNTLIYGVEMLRSLPRCDPFVPGQLEPVEKRVRDTDDEWIEPTSLENEDVLRGKATQRPSGKYPKSLNKTIKRNQNIDRKKNQTILKQKNREIKQIARNKQNVK